MKRWLLLLLLVIPSSALGQVYKFNVPCQQGGKLFSQPSIVSPGTNTPTNFSGSYPGATVTVYLTGTLTKATLYSDSSHDPLSNPTTCDATGIASGYVTSATYDFTFSGTGISTPFTLTFPITVGNAAVKPLTSDAIQYVSTDANSSDSNDGLSWGSAVADLATAYSNLPSCTVPNYFYYAGSGSTYQNYTYDHCGSIYVGAGIFSVSTETTFDSPYVWVYGSTSGNTTFNYSGSSGCFLYWYANPFAGTGVPEGGLYGVRIDGYGNSNTNICGVETIGIGAWHAQGVIITNFNQAGDVGWEDFGGTASVPQGFAERNDIEMTLENNTIGMDVNATYADGATFGYGRYDLKFTVFNNQSAFVLNGGTFAYNLVHMIVNIVGSSSVNGIVLNSNSGSGLGTNMEGGVYDIHIEAPNGISSGNAIKVASGVNFVGGGYIDEDPQSQNSNSGFIGVPPFSLENYSNGAINMNWLTGTSYGLVWNLNGSMIMDAHVDGSNGLSFYNGTINELQLEPAQISLFNPVYFLGSNPTDGSIPACLDSSSIFSTGCGPQVTSVAYSATPTFTFSNNAQTQEFKCTTAGASVTPTFSGLSAGLRPIIIFVQNGTTACTFTWPSTAHNAPTVTTTLNGVTTALFVVSGNGTDMYNLGSNSCTSSCGTP